MTKQEIIEKIEVIINRHSPMNNFDIKENCAKDIYKEIFDKYRDEIFNEIDEFFRLRLIKEANTPLKERKSGWEMFKEIRNKISQLKTK